MSEKDVVLSKINIVKNCLMVIDKAKTQSQSGVSDELFLLPLFEINLQRSIQASIDMAHLVIAKEGLGLLSTYR